jgi:hypothetical protein
MPALKGDGLTRTALPPSLGKAVGAASPAETTITSVQDVKIKPCRNAEHMNMRGVFLHIFGDFLGSIVVCVVAGTLILCKKYDCGGTSCSNDNQACHEFSARTGEAMKMDTEVLCEAPCWTLYLDPALSIAMLVIILSSTIPLLKDSAFILLQTVPTHIHVDRVQKDLLRKIPSIKGIHEFHVWQLAGNRIIASAHVQCHSLAEYDQMATDIKSYFHDKGIHSTTIQPEFIESQPAKAPELASSVDSGKTQQSGVPSQSCLIMCGPEKSCGDTEVCCPRPAAGQEDALRRRVCSSTCSLNKDTDAGGCGQCKEGQCCDHVVVVTSSNVDNSSARRKPNSNGARSDSHA